MGIENLDENVLHGILKGKVNDFRRKLIELEICEIRQSEFSDDNLMFIYSPVLDFFISAFYSFKISQDLKLAENLAKASLNGSISLEKKGQLDEDLQQLQKQIILFYNLLQSDKIEDNFFRHKIIVDFTKIFENFLNLKLNQILEN